MYGIITPALSFPMALVYAITLSARDYAAFIVLYRLYAELVCLPAVADTAHVG